MHIAVIPSWYPADSKDIGGSFFREQALALQRFNHQVGVIYPHQLSVKDYKKFRMHGNEITKEFDEGMPTYRNFGLGWLPRLPYANMKLWVAKGLQIFAEYIKDHGKPDIIHAHSMLYAGALASAIKRRYNIPFVVTEHSSAYVSKSLSDWQRKASMQVAANANMRIGVSEFFCDYLTHYLNPSLAWLYVPNILSYQFSVEVKKTSTDKPDKFTFLNVSLLTENKGIALLLNAFARSFAGNDNFCLNIAGDGPMRSSLEELSCKLGIKNQVRFLGLLSRENVLKIMHKSDAYVLTSQIETFGVVLIEALALGLPVVATRCGGPQSIIIDNKNGYLVNNNDVSDISNGMQKVFDNYAQFDEIEIRNDCLQRFSEETVVAELTREYQKMIAG
jgi:glycosyltransferase involved in cell wall biosynthesis